MQCALSQKEPVPAGFVVRSWQIPLSGVLTAMAVEIKLAEHHHWGLIYQNVPDNPPCWTKAGFIGTDSLRCI
jgi:hypothetical protein